LNADNIRLLITINFATQMGLLATIIVAAVLARRKKQFQKHCTIMRVVGPVQIATIIGIMAPAITIDLQIVARATSFGVEVLAHHVLGLIVVGLFIYINLVYRGTLKPRFQLVKAMRLALASWLGDIGFGHTSVPVLVRISHHGLNAVIGSQTTNTG
jgi:hypothetical protein